MKLSDFDLASQAEAGFDLTLKHPVTRESLDAVIRVVGADSKTYRNAAVALAQSMSAKAEYDERVKAGAKLLAAATLDWSNIEDDRGKEMPFSKEKAAEVYAQFDWIAGQVRSAIENRANFFGKQPAS